MAMRKMKAWWSSVTKQNPDDKYRSISSPKITTYMSNSNFPEIHDQSISRTSITTKESHVLLEKYGIGVENLSLSFKQALEIEFRNQSSVLLGTLIFAIIIEYTGSILIGSDGCGLDLDTGRMTSQTRQKILEGKYHVMAGAGHSVFTTVLHKELDKVTRAHECRFRAEQLGEICAGLMKVLRPMYIDGMREKYPNSSPNLEATFASSVILALYDVPDEDPVIPRLMNVYLAPGMENAIFDELPLMGCVGSYYKRPLQYLNEVYRSIKTEDDGIQVLKECLRQGESDCRADTNLSIKDPCVGGNGRFCLMTANLSNRRCVTHYDFGLIRLFKPPTLLQKLQKLLLKVQKEDG